MKKKNILILLLSIALVFFLFSTIYFYHEFHVEKEKLKKALVPALKEDYFTKISLTAESKINIEKNTESSFAEYSSKYQIPNPYEENFYSDKKKILDVPRMGQMPLFPNGCEAVSATMFLNYFGFSITAEDFINNYLPKAKVWEKDGVRYGPNPKDFYAGDPKDEKRGWGTFAPVILNALEKSLDGSSYLVSETTGKNINYLISDLPAIIWVGVDYQELSDVYMWFNESETEVYTYPKNSHTVLLVGYDKDNFYINDPLKPEETVKVSRTILEKSYNSYGRQSIIMYQGRTGLFK